MDKCNYSFAYYVNGRDSTDDMFAVEDTITRDLTYNDSITWDVVLRDFIDFLSSVYGYDIGDQVKFRTLRDKLADLEDEAFEWEFDDEVENDEGKETPQV